jgi:hypothetical protein
MSGLSTVAGTLPSFIKVCAASKSRLRVRAIMRSDGARCSSERSTISPMHSIIAWSCRPMPWMPV